MKNFLFFFFLSCTLHAQTIDSTSIYRDPDPIEFEVVLTNVKLVNVNILQLGNFNMLECKTRYWGKIITLLLPLDAPVYDKSVVTVVEGFNVPRHILVNNQRYYDYQHKRMQ
jgi:hypothetical protein